MNDNQCSVTSCRRVSSDLNRVPRTRSWRRPRHFVLCDSLVCGSPALKPRFRELWPLPQASVGERSLCARESGRVTYRRCRDCIVQPLADACYLADFSALYPLRLGAIPSARWMVWREGQADIADPACNLRSLAALPIPSEAA